MKSIRIVSDGRYTKVFDVATGTELQKIIKAVIVCSANNLTEATLTFEDVEVDITAHVQEQSDKESMKEHASL